MSKLGFAREKAGLSGGKSAFLPALVKLRGISAFAGLPQGKSTVEQSDHTC